MNRYKTLLQAVILSFASAPAFAAVEAPSGLIPAGLNSGEQIYVIFVTSDSRTANSALIADYDTFVNISAASGLPNGTAAAGLVWRAVAATSTADQCDPYLGGDPSLPIYTTGGTLVATNRANFISQTFVNNIVFNQLGAAALNFVWSGCAPGAVAPVPTPAVAVPTMTTYSIALTALGLLLLANRRLRESVKRR